jgi:hypothetical protein
MTKPLEPALPALWSVIPDRELQLVTRLMFDGPYTMSRTNRALRLYRFWGRRREPERCTRDLPKALAPIGHVYEHGRCRQCNVSEPPCVGYGQPSARAAKGLKP